MIFGHIDIEPVVQKMAIESSLKNIEAVEKMISQLKEEFALSEESCDDIWLALHEAVSNAIRHGNKFDSSKKVRISVESKYGRYVCFTIKDEGEGFNPAGIPDPTHPDRIEEPNGRGVFLINQLADLVSYSQNGTCLEMCFALYKS
ncbi:MAG TPA: ATP-binding protein [Bacteroidia bacterium]|jgi:serine/threonine-protein kinase RsbW